MYVVSDVFRQAAFGANHPLSIVRHAAVFDLASMLGWLDRDALVDAPPASVDTLIRFHNRDYVEALQYADAAGRVAADTRARFNVGTLENPLFPGLFRRAATTVGGSIAAAELALAGHVAFHPSGGTHHGRPNRASGFCYFNDPVFAILTLLDRGRRRVAYIDLDAHHGDGVEAAFADDPRVVTVSIHEDDRWPNSGHARDNRDGVCNLPVPRGFNDAELAFLTQRALLPLAAEADALVICCGADSLAGDPLSGMQLTNVALWNAVLALVGLGQPTVVLGGGGYNPWTLCRYWAGLWGRLCGHDMPERLPAEARALLAAMECDLIDDDDVDPAWFDSMADSPYPGAVRDAVTSLLGWLPPSVRRSL